jgi:predicted RNase H-like HicB family nuclease
LPATRPIFTATFERAENGTWAVALVEEPNVHGYGDTLAEARRNIRDAIVTLFGPFESNEDGFHVVEDVRLPETVLAMVERARAERKRANQRREDARAAEEAVATATSDALAATRQAAGLLAEHGELVKAESESGGLVADIRLPELVLQAVERAHMARQAARRQGATARAAHEAANAISTEAIVTNREAARLLTQQCGLSRTEAAGLLGLSPERVQRLLTG